MYINRADVALVAVIFIIFIGFTLSSCGEIFDEGGGPKGTSSGSGSTHRAGQNCNGCHDLSYSGTVYTDATGANKATGVTVIITEAGGDQITMITDNSGNFWTGNGNPGGRYTATINGNTTAMAATQSSGACTQSGCHGGSQAVIFTN